MRLEAAPPEWLEGLVIDLTETDLIAELAPGFVKNEFVTAWNSI